MQELIDSFKSFLESNINGTCSEGTSKYFKEGVCDSSFLLNPPEIFLDPLIRSRFMYIRNLCLREPIEFEIPCQISKYEKALMILSFNKISSALEALETPFQCNVIGTNAKTRTGAEVNIPVLLCTNTASQETLEYNADGYTYENFSVQPLKYNELLYCYIKMIDIMRNEENETLKKFRLGAYLKRVLMVQNALNVSLRRAFLIIQAEVNSVTEELEKIKHQEIELDEMLFEYPITFKSEVLIQLGLAYKNRYYYKEAYEYLSPYPFFIEKIDCLISLKKAEEAVTEINNYLNTLEGLVDRESGLIKCDLYIKLAHLFQDATYYEKAFLAFRSSKPFYMKGLFHFKRKEYENALVAFQMALSITPQDEKIRFSYACSLVEVDKIAEALKVFKELKQENPTNEQVAKNLGYCYYKLEDVENTLLSLKKTALNDENSLNQFFILSIKNNKFDNIKWALCRMSSLELIRGGISYLRTHTSTDESFFKEALVQNPYFDISAISTIFEK
ncbi:hypothetical protein GINT2_001479 [Glugoides intestinalis]